MKNISILFISLLFAVNAFSQAPDKMSYQAVIRNSDSRIVADQKIGLQISILKDTEDGQVVYSEVQSPTTNSNGLVSIEFGGEQGWSDIDWSDGVYFIKTETDPEGNSNYTITGTSKLLSVPYSMFAKNAGSVNSMPAVFTNIAINITVTGAVCGGNIVTNGGSEITARGVCWSTRQNPTLDDSVTVDGAGTGYFTSEITDVAAGNTYYIRAYATNDKGTSYGNQVVLDIPSSVVFPTVTTTSVTNITANGATSGGTITDTGGAEVTARGVCWSANQNPTVSDSKTVDGEGDGQFQSQLDNLNSGMVYYIRAYATNSSGTGYGEQVTLTTLKTAPVVVTREPISITAMGAVSGGTITLTGGGAITEKGICWSESQNPTINDNKVTAGSGTDAFYSAINKLKPNTTCYVRAYAVNEIGIAYGEQKTFTTLDAFYDGFETGFSGNTGGWGIVLGDAIEGAYSLYTSVNGSVATLTRKLSNSGQIAFYTKITNEYYAVSISFYIDDVLQGTYSNTFWGLQSFPVTAGEHSFKWQFSSNNSRYSGWIDYIVMPE
ncbi:MAG: hypothetical protein GXO47_02775 [Chlorobi bacterium]|nr:hypothetical protein [Chlorobiota bacterium]